MEIREYVGVIWRRKWVVLVTLLMTTTIVAIGTFSPRLAITSTGLALTSSSSPIYVATATVRIFPIPGAEVGYYHYMYGELLRNTYARMVTSKPVLEQVRVRLGLKAPPKAEQIEANIIEDTELIELRVEDPDPAYAREVANALAEVLVAQDHLLSSTSEASAQMILGEDLDQVERELLQMQAEYDNLLEQTPPDLERIGTLARSIRLKESVQAMLLDRYERVRVAEVMGTNVVSLIEPATTPTAAARPRPVVNMAAAIAAGLMAGLGLAFLFENLDTRVYSQNQVEAISEIPVLGLVPASTSRHHVSTRIGTRGRHVIDPAYRLLQTSLASVVNRGARTFLMTSVDSEAGKAQIIKDLAICMAEAGQGVIVVEAGPQKQELYRLFGVADEPESATAFQQLTEMHEGLLPATEASAALIRETEFPQIKLVAVRLREDGLWTQSDLHEVSKLIQSLNDQADVVVINAPPVLSAPEVCLLSPAVDGVLLVIRLGRTTTESIQKALKQLSNVGAKVIGTILSGTKAA